MKQSALHLSAWLLDRGLPVRELTLEPGETINRGCREDWTLAVRAPNGDGWSLLVDDAPVALDADGSWRWSPGFFSGLVEAQLHRQGRHLASYCLEVAPDADKLALSMYQQMLDELVDIDPILAIGTEPATTKMGALGPATDPWVEFRRLRRHGPDFIAALHRLTKQPIRTVRSARRTAPLRTARRIDMQTVRSAVTMGAIGPLVPGFEATESQAIQTEPCYDLPWFEEHYDGPANRCITALLLAVQRRARDLLARLEELVNRDSDSETRTGLVDRWPVRRHFLQRLLRELKPVLRAEPFRSVTVPEITAAGLTAIAAHPTYSRAYRCGWSAIRRGVRTSDAMEAVWLCPSWELYERWCFARVVKQLKSLTGVEGVTGRDVSRGIWKARLATGARLRAEGQRTFSSNQGSEFRSVSRERRPDVVLTIESGSDRRYLTMDAKYTQARSGVLAAMASAHIYNDSLRWQGQRPAASYLMVPAGGGAPWLEEEDFQKQEGVGVMPLSPQTGDEQLERLLKGFLHSRDGKADLP